MQEKFYYIVGVSLVVLLVLVVYVGSRVQNLELGLMNVDSRLSAIESQLGIVNKTSYDSGAFSNDQYGASVYDTLQGDSYQNSVDSADTGYDAGYDDGSYNDGSYDYTIDQ